MSKMETAIATSDASSITLHGYNLVDEIIGKVTFTQMIYRHLAGRFPTEAEAILLDACLVTLMEHGITPSALISRLVADSLPGQLQVAVASGLNAVGSVFVGTMDGCGQLLQGAVRAPDREAFLRAAVKEHLASGQKLPGFGHPFHKPDDPRTSKLLELAQSVALHGSYCDALRHASATVDLLVGKHLTVNATGAVSALLLEAGLDPAIFRGVAVISRSAGLVGHVQEERARPMARSIWRLIEDNTTYIGKQSKRL